MIKQTTILKLIQDDKQVDVLRETDDFIQFLTANDLNYSEDEVQKMSRQQLIFATKQVINRWFAPELDYEERRVKARLDD